MNMPGETRGGRKHTADWALKKMGHADVIMQAIFYTYDHEKNISGAPSGGKSYILHLASVRSAAEQVFGERRGACIMQCLPPPYAGAFGCLTQSFRTNPTLFSFHNPLPLLIAWSSSVCASCRLVLQLQGSRSHELCLRLERAKYEQRVLSVNSIKRPLLEQSPINMPKSWKEKENHFHTWFSGRAESFLLFFFFSPAQTLCWRADRVLIHKWKERTESKDVITNANAMI